MLRFYLPGLLPGFFIACPVFDFSFTGTHASVILNS